MSSVEDDKYEEARKREEREKVRMRLALSENILMIGWAEYNNGLFANVDSFLELSKESHMVEDLYLDPYWCHNRIRRSDADWEVKLGKAIGNLQSLKGVWIQYSHHTVTYAEEPPDWESVARVLRQVCQKIALFVDIRPTRGSEEAFARAIRGHPTIQRFETSCSFHFDSFGIIASALATLPALESAVLYHDAVENDDLPDMEHPEHITTLLLSPSLRSVEFKQFQITNSVSQAIALALRTGSPITRLTLTRCPSVDGSGGAIVSALQRNSTLKKLRLVDNEFDESVYDALTSVLLVNTTLPDLTLHTPWNPRIRCTWLQPFFVALRMNTSLKKLDVSYVSMSDELACGALREVFAKNSVLEKLTLHCGCGPLPGGTDDSAWRRTLPSLRDNKTLKSLVIIFNAEVVAPQVATICVDMVAMLEDNISLECLDIYSSRGISLDNYFTALESLQTNTTLKTLRLDPNLNSVSDDDKIKHLISLVKKNYGLENLDEGLSAQDKTGELATILRLNQAGRRYLIEEDAGSMAKGVEVLVAVRHDLGSLFYHLLENPLLCEIEHRHVGTGMMADGPVHNTKRQRTSK
jgi:hypothetical protein